MQQRVLNGSVERARNRPAFRLEKQIKKKSGLVQVSTLFYSQRKLLRRDRDITNQEQSRGCNPECNFGQKRCQPVTSAAEPVAHKTLAPARPALPTCPQVAAGSA